MINWIVSYLEPGKSSFIIRSANDHAHYVNHYIITIFFCWFRYEKIRHLGYLDFHQHFNTCVSLMYIVLIFCHEHICKPFDCWLNCMIMIAMYNVHSCNHRYVSWLPFQKTRKSFLCFHFENSQRCLQMVLKHLLFSCYKHMLRWSMILNLLFSFSSWSFFVSH